MQRLTFGSQCAQVRGADQGHRTASLQSLPMCYNLDQAAPSTEVQSKSDRIDDAPVSMELQSV